MTLGSARQELAARVAGLADLWEATNGDPEIRIAVLDGPVDPAHPALRGASLQVVESGVPAVPRDDAATAHGTAVASLLFGSPDGPAPGLAPHCSGIVIPVFSCDESGAVVPCSQLDLARAILLAAANRANVINISGGQYEASRAAAPELEQAVALCREAGILVVAATGNDACACAQAPALLRSVLAVGAMDDDGTPLPESNWGAAYDGHGVVALGGELLVAAPHGGVTRKSGTSYATAVVSGVAGLLLSAVGRDAADAVFSALIETADSSRPGDACERLLAGRLNVPQAIQRLTEGGSMTEATTTCIDPAPMAGVPGIAGDGVLPSGGCGCGGPSEAACKCPGGAPAPAAGPQLVYAIGRIGYDFGTEARRDSLIQTTGRNLLDVGEFLAATADNPVIAGSIIWTLEISGTPVYAIMPGGAFAERGHARLRDALAAQSRDGGERTSVPGVVAGTITLSSGRAVPVIHPDLRGIFTWATADLARAAAGDPKKRDEAASQRHVTVVSGFLERVYYELRNLGIAPPDRALNFAATNVFHAGNIFRDAVAAGVELDSIGVERSPICRPSGDCWDVRLTFFHPMKRLEQARLVYRFTVDVSDTVPVAIGNVRSWHVY